MTKAFTKDDEGTPPPPPSRRGVPVPDPNFVTPAGAAEAKAELERLVRDGGDRDRIRELSEHLATAIALPPAERDTVGLGASVTIETEAGLRKTYQIVGAIEADAKRGRISLQSELATALWGARRGDTIELPRGESAEVIEIRY